MPKLSIITINFNDESGLEKTIQSVISQTVSDFEFIIIDGGSTDNSVNVLNQFADKITSWISEKDKGIYDAQNKGIEKASGDYLLFLNSGDCLYNENVLKDFYNFSSNNHRKIIYGNANVLNKDGSSYIVIPPQKIDINFWYASTLTHQAVFIEKKLFKKYGFYNTEYKFGADFDFLFNMFLKETSEFVHFDQFICNYDNTGLTSQDQYHKMIIAEKRVIIKSYLSRRQFNRIRKNYLSGLSFKRRYTVIIRENAFLRTLLKPFYKLFFS
ncbi:MAG: glycosyltransferase family 2 protein [Bacteroidetes bacterium]|nr:glycosyltransferase family 2 protein [Bacteroidota bacterium]